MPSMLLQIQIFLLYPRSTHTLLKTSFNRNQFTHFHSLSSKPTQPNTQPSTCSSSTSFPSLPSSQVPPWPRPSLSTLAPAPPSAPQLLPPPLEPPVVQVTLPELESFLPHPPPALQSPTPLVLPLTSRPDPLSVFSLSEVSLS